MGILNWERITALLTDPEEGPSPHPFELQWMEFGPRIYTSYIGEWVWKGFVRGLPEAQNSGGEASERQGWHFRQNETHEWAVLTHTGEFSDPDPASSMPWVALSTPHVVYGIAIDWRFLEDVILNRQYPRPQSCVDAVRTILQAWDTTPRSFEPTLLTIHGVTGVIL